VQCYREYIGIGTTLDDHLRILITARFTTGEILRAYDMPSCIADDEMYDDRDKYEDDMCSEVQSPLANPALVYPALAQHRSVDGEFRPCPNDFSSLIRSRVRSSHDNPASLIGSAKTQ
jgi:hypothetical protein